MDFNAHLVLLCFQHVMIHVSAIYQTAPCGLWNSYCYIYLNKSLWRHYFQRTTVHTLSEAVPHTQCEVITYH